MEIGDLIGNYAFPVAVTVWLLYERSKTLGGLTQAVEANTRALDELVAYLKRP